MDKHMDTAVIFVANNAYAPGVIVNIAQIEHLHSDFADKYLVTQELHRNMNAELLSADEIKKNDIELKSSISNLAASFYALHQTPENLAKLSAIKGKDILEYLKTLENYFVTPGDLLFNCPALRYIGTLFSTEPNKIGK